MDRLRLGRPRRRGRPNTGVAIDAAETLGIMPLRARIAPTTAEELDLLELPAAALSIKDGEPPWWRDSRPAEQTPAAHVDHNIRIFEELCRLILTDASSQHEPAIPHTTLRIAISDVLRKSRLDSGRTLEVIPLDDPFEYELPQTTPTAFRQRWESHDTFGSGLPDGFADQE